MVCSSFLNWSRRKASLQNVSSPFCRCGQREPPSFSSSQEDIPHPPQPLPQYMKPRGQPLTHGEVQGQGWHLLYPVHGGGIAGLDSPLRPGCRRAPPSATAAFQSSPAWHLLETRSVVEQFHLMAGWHA